MSAIDRAIKHFGSQAAMAAALDVSQPTISEWLRGERPVPEDRALAIEVKTEGLVRVEELCPSTHWHRIADKSWPRGKPLIDRTAKAA